MTTPTMLDAIVDLVEAGHGDRVTVYVITEPCQHPTIKPYSGYTLGCRCERCRAGKAAYDHAYNHAYRHKTHINNQTKEQ